MIEGSTLDLVVGCTDRKLRVPPAGLRFGERPSGSLEFRLTDWTRALDASEAESSPASTLYAGDHWSVVRSVASAPGPALQVRIWVASAGYGLIGLETPVRAYGATFSTGHSDTVAPASSGYSSADWWEALSSWRPRGWNGARSVRELAEAAQATARSFVLLALSGPYLNALSRDIAAARQISERLATISVGGAASGHGRRRATLNLIRSDARLKARVGGAMHAINARVVREAIAEHEHWYPSFDALQTVIDQWMAEAAPMPVYKRDRRSDDDVRALIQEALRRDPRMSQTRLLRELRDAGQACEQGRFRSLFTEVRDSQVRPRTDQDAGA